MSPFQSSGIFVADYVILPRLVFEFNPQLVVLVHHIASAENPADVLTKPLDKEFDDNGIVSSLTKPCACTSVLDCHIQSTRFPLTSQHVREEGFQKVLQLRCENTILALLAYDESFDALELHYIRGALGSNSPSS